MDAAKPIVNRVERSGLITLDLADYMPKQADIVVIDLKQYLFKELILKEADFRTAIGSADYSNCRGKYVVIHCSTNAIIPMWAYMLITTAVVPFALDVVCSPPEHAAEVFLYRQLQALPLNDFQDKRVLIKGCGDTTIPEAAFVYVTQRLTGVVRSLMYGEACSSVPVYKKQVH